MQQRRRFIKHLGLAVSGLTTLGISSCDFGNSSFGLYEVFKPIRVRGRIISGGNGLAKVTVSDGFRVVQTDRNGDFEFISDDGRDFVFLSIPSGYKIPLQKNGSAAFFFRIDKSKGENEVIFDLQPLEKSDQKHHFLLLADTQIQDGYEAGQLINVAAPDVSATVRDINDPNIFGINCGDLVYDQLNLFNEYNDAVNKMGIPFFQVLGNHDMGLNMRTQEMTADTFKDHFGPTYYSFNRGEIHYVVMDDVLFVGNDRKYIGYFTENQLTWLERDLSFVEPGSTVMLSVHIPLITGALERYPNRDYSYATVSNREQLYKLLEPFNAHILSGHTHFNDNIKGRNIYEHCHGTVCGAWWSGPICYDGTPNGYGVYSVNGSTVSWKYKTLGKPVDHQFRVYEKGRHPEFREFWCTNVWNWDDDWKVTWYEDGIRKGEMLRVVAHDPLSIELHKGPDIPVRRSWVEPQLSDHVFFFKPDENVRQLIVEVRDPFGNIYKDVIKD